MGKSLLDNGAGRQWSRLRKVVLARDMYRCQVCGTPGTSADLRVDHIVERRFGGDDDLANLQTLCQPCHNRKTAANYATQRRIRQAQPDDDRSMRGRAAPRPPTGKFVGGTGSHGDLTGLEEDGSPRFFPEPHPMAVGTRGGELAVYAEEVMGTPLLDWQRTLADAILSVDASGRWTRRLHLCVVPRQSGKSQLGRALCEWLASQGQFVLCSSAKLVNVAHLMRPTQLRCRDLPGFKSVSRVDQPELNFPGWDEDHYRWVGQASNAMLGRGFTADTVLLDEIQDIGPAALEAVSPSLVERDNPLIVMMGTAPRADSPPLFLQQRKIALEGGPVALYEWSAPTGADFRDEEVWRASSPRWTPARLRHLRDEVRSQPEHHIRTEYLCQPTLAAGTDPWLDVLAWSRARRVLGVPMTGDTVAAVEDGRGGVGGSVSVAWADGGTVHVVGTLTETLAEAWQVAAGASRVLCGVTLKNEKPALDLRAKAYGRRETSTALPELRRLLTTDCLRWDGDDLDAQIRSANVREDANGSLVVAPNVPTGILRTAAWAVQAVRLTRDPVLV